MSSKECSHQGLNPGPAEGALVQGGSAHGAGGEVTAGEEDDAGLLLEADLATPLVSEPLDLLTHLVVLVLRELLK